MVIRKEINLPFGKDRKRLHLLFNESFTRIATGTNGSKTNSGLTSYFRRLKREVEVEKEAEKYIFVFSVKDWNHYREDIINAVGKIIVVDNAGITLFADETIKDLLGTSGLIEQNQWIVKDWCDEPGGKHGLPILDRDGCVGWLSEIERKGYTEVRLTYKEKLAYLGEGEILFTSAEAVQAYGLDLVKAPRDIYEDGTSDFDVLDVTGQTAEQIMKYLNTTPRAKIYSESLPDAEIVRLCTPIIISTEDIKICYDEDDVLCSSEWNHQGLTETFYHVKNLGGKSKILCPMRVNEAWLSEIMLVLTKTELNGNESMLATAFLSENHSRVQCELVRKGDPEKGMFSLRVVESVELKPHDAATILWLISKDLVNRFRLEGQLLWDIKEGWKC